MSFAPRAVLALVVLGSLWPATRACRGPGWEPLGASDLGSDDARVTGPGGTSVRSVALGPGGRVTVEWREQLDLTSPASLHGRAWDGRRWGPLVAPMAVGGDRQRRAHVAPATPDGWSAIVGERLTIVRAGRREEVPLPERPVRHDGGCVGGPDAPYLGPARVAFDAAGAAWFFEPIETELNAWRRDDTQWRRVGPFHAETSSGGTLGYLAEEPQPFPPAVAFDAQGNPLVAWTVDYGGTVVETRHWTGARWRDLGAIPTSAPTLGDEPVPALVLLPGGTAALAASGALYTRTSTGTWSLVADTPVDTALAAMPDGRLARAGTRIGEDGERHLVAEALTDGRWDLLASWPLPRYAAPAKPAFAHGPDGRLALSWWDDGVVVATWDGAGFRRLSVGEPGPGLADIGVHGSELRLWVDEEGRPTATWWELGTRPTIRGVQWTGTSWSSLPPAEAERVALDPFELPELWAAEDWMHGDPSGCLDGSHASFTFDAERRPTVFVVADEGQTVRACRSTPGGWLRLADPPLSAGAQHWTRIASASTPSGTTVAWIERGPATDRVEVRRWEGEAWTVIGDSPVVAECDGGCRDLVVAAGGGRICVAWTEPVGPQVRLALRCHADRAALR